MIIEDALHEAGGVPRVAERFEINPVSVYEWISRNKLPAARVIPLAELTDWRFTPHQLDPLLYPNPTDGIPPPILAEQAPPCSGS